MLLLGLSKNWRLVKMCPQPKKTRDKIPKQILVMNETLDVVKEESEDEVVVVVKEVLQQEQRLD
jgi:hypothetical protein